MIEGCVPFSKLPGYTGLAADFVEAFHRVARFYSYDPADPAAVQRRLERLRFGAEYRRALVETLRGQNGPCPPLERLARSDAVAVLAGQQVGLFTGPAFTFYKALTAVRIADALTQQGIPAAAVFWLASEDHDYPEINHCWVFDLNGAAVRIEAEADADASGGRRPAGAITLPDGLVEQFRRAAEGLPHQEEVADLLSGCYMAGRSFASAFGKLLRELLGPDRLLTFDPLECRARELLAQPLAAVAEKVGDLARIVAARNVELAQAGYHQQVRVDDSSTLLFLLQQGERLPVRLAENGLEAGATRFDRSELVARAKDLSPAALLRPIVQDWIFPTAICVVGPSELAYLAQASAVYDFFGVEKPVWRLRASCTLLDPRARRLWARYRLRLEDFFGGREAFRELLAARVLSPEIAAITERCSAEIRAALERMSAAVAEAGGTLPRSFAKSRSKIEYQLAKIARGIAREALQRDQVAQRHADWLLRQIYPNGTLQERLYSIVAFLARHGLGLAERLLEAVSPECKGHQLIAI